VAVRGRSPADVELGDTVVFIEQPLKLFPGETPRFSFRVVDIDGGVSGLEVGVSEAAPHYSETRVDLADWIESRSWRVDAAGWVHVGDDATMSGWDPGTLRSDDQVLVQVSPHGNLQVFVNGKIKVDFAAGLMQDPNVQQLWGFVALTGIVQSVSLLSDAELSRQDRRSHRP